MKNTNKEKEDLKWRHPGGKFIEKGPGNLTDAELLAIIISTGIKGKSAEEIAKDTLRRFDSFLGMLEQPLTKFLEIKGLGDVKILRIAAALEIACRIHKRITELESKYDAFISSQSNKQKKMDEKSNR